MLDCAGNLQKRVYHTATGWTEEHTSFVEGFDILVPLPSLLHLLLLLLLAVREELLVAHASTKKSKNCKMEDSKSSKIPLFWPKGKGGSTWKFSLFWPVDSTFGK